MGEPKLRGNLDIAERPGEAVIKDPLRNKFYRFSGASALVLKTLDGRLGLDEISNRLERQANVKISPEAVRAFVERLRSAGLLEGSQGPAETHRRHRDDILNIRLKAIDPRRVFDWLLPRTTFLFTRTFVGVSLAIMVAAAHVVVTRGGEIAGSIADLMMPSRLVESLLIALTIAAIHEFAHGLASERFGARVGEMGFLLLYFQPCLYCDVSGSWVLTKRQRLLVMLAGNWSTFLIWALATLAWRILDPQTILSHLCVSAIVLSSLAMFANFNPLIRLDGYYMLSDIVGIPNLRARAFTYLRSRIEGKASAVKPHERLTFILYGAGAALFSLALIGSAICLAGRYLLSHFHLAGMALMVATLVAVPAATQSKPDAIGVLTSLLRAAGKKFRNRWRVLALVGAVVSVALMPWELKVGGAFRILAERELAITPEIDGQIATIYVDEGTRVRQGQPIATLANPDLARSVARTRSELDGSRARLHLLRAGARPEEIERLRAEVSRKELEVAQARDPETERKRLTAVVERRGAELTYAQQSLARAAQLFDLGLIPKMTFEREQQSFAVQQKLFDEARGALSVLIETKAREAELREKELLEARSQMGIALAGSRREEIDAAEAEVRRLDGELAFLQGESRRATVVSPADGIIATPHLGNRAGQFIHRGDTLCRIAVSAAETIVEMAVPEKEAGDVAVGYPVAVKLNSYLSRPTLRGRVSSIAPEVDASSGANFVRVECRIHNDSGLLKPGMAGAAKIYCGRRNVLNVATRRALSWLRTEFWTWLP